MKANIPLYILYFLFIISSCNIGNAQRVSLDNLDRYKLVTMTNRTNEDDIFLGRAQRINLIYNYLVVNDIYDGKMITLVSKDLKSSKHILHRGMGPGEFYNGLSIYQTQGNLVKIVEQGLGRIRTFKWDDVINERVEKALASDTIKSMGALIPWEGNYVISDVKNDNNLVSLVTSKQKELARFAKYPGEIAAKHKNNAMTMNMLLECLINVNQKQNVIVVAGRHSDYLSFYKMEGVRAVLLHEYFTYSADRDILENDNMISIRDNERTMLAYNDLCAGQKYLYALYEGMKMKQKERPKYTYLRVFDWNGNFVKGYKFNELLYDIAVDEKSNTLYGLASGESDHICIYKLDDL